MPSPDLADAGQLPGDFVQQGRVGLSEVEHGCVRSAGTKDSEVWTTKQPDHEPPILKLSRRQCAAAAAFQAKARSHPLPRRRGQSWQRTPLFSKVHVPRVSAPCDKNGPTPESPSENGEGFCLGGKGPLAGLLVGHRPLRVCPAAHRLAQPRIPQPQNPSPFSDRLRMELSRFLEARPRLPRRRFLGDADFSGFGVVGCLS
jgi:hypothetical protein